MKFDDMDKKMRVFERSIDQVIPPQTYLVARLDGRNFTRLTKEVCKFEAPVDVRFRDMMVNTVKHLMQCGFRVIYGYTESDEISLLFHIDVSPTVLTETVLALVLKMKGSRKDGEIDFRD